MTTSASTSENEAALLNVINNWRHAFESKNIEGLVADYAPDATLYDVKPPYRVVGRDAIKKVWQQSLPCFPGSFKSEHRDLKIEVANDLAFVYGLHRITSTIEPTHPACASYLRITACFRKIDGKWKAVHEHVSLPFDPKTGSISPITDSAVAPPPINIAVV